MEYSEQTLCRVRHYLRNEDIQALDRNDPAPEGYSRYFTVPYTPKEPYNEVYPGIIIGNHVYAKDKNMLKKLEVKHVVNCAKGNRYAQINTSSSYFKDAGISFYGIRANDISTFDLSPYFQGAADFIDKALGSGGKVFVHCNMGISRSSTIVLAYLMLKREMNLMNAVRSVRAKREIMPNDGFLKQLAKLNFQLYEAKRVY